MFLYMLYYIITPLTTYQNNFQLITIFAYYCMFMCRCEHEFHMEKLKAVCNGNGKRLVKIS